MTESNGERLVRELLSDPAKFDEAGRAHDLLQCYFAGFPLETLRELLRSNDAHVQKAAAFLVEELAVRARELIDDMIPLLSSPDQWTRDDVLQAVAVCAKADLIDRYVHVIEVLKSENKLTRELAMMLVSNAQIDQLEAARRGMQQRSAIDVEGLDLLLSGDRERIDQMLRDPRPLMRCYAAIARERLK